MTCSIPWWLWLFASLGGAVALSVVALVVVGYVRAGWLWFRRWWHRRLVASLPPSRRRR